VAPFSNRFRDWRSLSTSNCKRGIDGPGRRLSLNATEIVDAKIVIVDAEIKILLDGERGS
jgi:hypothetical protein